MHAAENPDSLVASLQGAWGQQQAAAVVGAGGLLPGMHPLAGAAQQQQHQGLGLGQQQHWSFAAPALAQHSPYGSTLGTGLQHQLQHGLQHADRSSLAQHLGQPAHWQQQQQQHLLQAQYQLSGVAMGHLQPQQHHHQQQQLPIAQLQANLLPQQPQLSSPPMLLPHSSERAVALGSRHFNHDGSMQLSLYEQAAAAAASAQREGASGVLGQVPDAAAAALGSFSGLMSGRGAGAAPAWAMQGTGQQQQQQSLVQSLVGSSGSGSGASVLPQGLGLHQQAVSSSAAGGSAGPGGALGLGGLPGAGNSSNGSSSEVALLQAALTSGNSDDVMRAFAVQRLLQEGRASGSNSSSGAGVDMSTLLLLQSLNKDSSHGGSQPLPGGGTDTLLQALLHKQQQQQQPQSQQQQLLQALVSSGQQQQQLPPAQPLLAHLEGGQPSSAAPAAAGWSGAMDNGDGRTSQHGMAAGMLAPGDQQQQLQAPGQQQQQAMTAAGADPQQASLSGQQNPSAAAAPAQEQPQQHAAEAAAEPDKTVDNGKAAAAAALPPGDAAGGGSADASSAEQSRHQHKPASAQHHTPAGNTAEKQPGAEAKHGPATGADPAAAAAAGTALNPAATAAMPAADTNNRRDNMQVLEQLAADTLLNMHGRQHTTAAHHHGSGLAAGPAASAAMAAAPSAADTTAVAAAAAKQAQQDAVEAAVQAAAEAAREGQQQQPDVNLPAANTERNHGGSQAHHEQQQQPSAQSPQQQQQQVMGWQQLLLESQSQPDVELQDAPAAAAAVADAQQQPPAPSLPRRAPEEGLWQRVLGDLSFYLEEDCRAAQEATAAGSSQPPSKRARTAPSLDEGGQSLMPPDRAAMSFGDQQALGQVLALVKERQQQLEAGFWQKAWHQVQRYLKLIEPDAEQQPDAAAAAAAGGGGAAAGAAEVGSKRSLSDAASLEPVPMHELAPAEHAALQKILTPVRKDQIAALQERLQGLAGLDPGGGLAGADVLGAAAAADPASAAAAAAAAANAMMMQGMGYGAFDPSLWLGGYGEAGDAGQDAGGAAAAADAQWEPRKFGSGRGRGGRPKGSGNRVQMAPRAAPAPAEAAVPAAEGGAAKFSLRSIKYTGVYRSRRSQEGWRAQFCYANKVINLGTFATEDEAARVWNEAALLFRGSDAWLNPVEPQLPDDYTPGELHLASDKAASAVRAAAVAAGLPMPKVVVKG